MMDMNKRKQERFADEPNLKRFRSEVKSLSKSDNLFKHASSVKSTEPKQSRKERRKEARVEKKMKKNAYSRKITVIHS